LNQLDIPTTMSIWSNGDKFYAERYLTLSRWRGMPVADKQAVRVGPLQVQNVPLLGNPNLINRDITFKSYALTAYAVGAGDPQTKYYGITSHAMALPFDRGSSYQASRILLGITHLQHADSGSAIAQFKEAASACPLPDARCFA